LPRTKHGTRVLLSWHSEIEIYPGSGWDASSCQRTSSCARKQFAFLQFEIQFAFPPNSGLHHASAPVPAARENNSRFPPISVSPNSSSSSCQLELEIACPPIPTRVLHQAGASTCTRYTSRPCAINPVLRAHQFMREIVQFVLPPTRVLHQAGAGTCTRYTSRPCAINPVLRAHQFLREIVRFAFPSTSRFPPILIRVLHADAPDPARDTLRVPFNSNSSSSSCGRTGTYQRDTLRVPMYLQFQLPGFMPAAWGIICVPLQFLELIFIMLAPLPARETLNGSLQIQF